MSSIQKTAMGFLIASLAGTVAFFSLLVANSRLDKGNEWFSYEWTIIAVTALAVIGTMVAFIGWRGPHGKKIAVGALCLLVAYYFIYFASWSSSSKGGSSGPSTDRPMWEKDITAALRKIEQ